MEGRGEKVGSILTEKFLVGPRLDAGLLYMKTYLLYYEAKYKIQIISCLLYSSLCVCRLKMISNYSHADNPKLKLLYNGIRNSIY